MKYRVVRRKDGLYHLQFWNHYKDNWTDSVSMPFEDKKEALEQRNAINKKYAT